MTQITLQGTGASSGVVMASAYRFNRVELTVPQRTADDPQAEMARFAAAQAKAQKELAALEKHVAATVGEDESAIFGAHQVLLNDPAIQSVVESLVNGGQGVESALAAAIEQVAEMLRGTGDPMFMARADDVNDVGRRLLRILLDVPDTSLAALSEPSIVVTSELSPSDTATLDPNLALGVCVAGGGVTAHAAILARTLGIPAVVTLGETAIAKIKTGDLVALDGTTGEVVVQPDDATQASYRQRQERMKARAEQIATVRDALTHTRDGQRVEVYANIGDAKSAQGAVTAGAEGVGLLRTEFLYLDRDIAPTEDEQIALYKEIFTAMGDRPVVVRTLDIGGDKPPSFMDFPHEMNPFLGWRGARVYPDAPELFKTQMKAIFQAAEGHQVKVMFPMIEGLPLLQTCRQLVDEARSELDAAGKTYAKDVPLGIMIETPSAALMADVLAASSDFFSIGTNDLTQYTLAADRDNAQVAPYFKMLHPSVLRLVAQAIGKAHQADRVISMCGAMAGMPQAIPVLVGLGLDKFSMVAGSIGEAKWIVSQFTLEECQKIAAEVLALPTAEAIEAHMNDILRARDLI